MSKRGLGEGCGYGEQKGIVIEEVGRGVGGKGRQNENARTRTTSGFEILVDGIGTMTVCDVFWC